jgi:hypothetical protein
LHRRAGRVAIDLAGFAEVAALDGCLGPHAARVSQLAFVYDL